MNEEHAKASADLPPPQDIPSLSANFKEKTTLQPPLETPDDIEDIPHFLNPQVENLHPSKEEKAGLFALGIVKARKLSQKIDDELQAEYWDSPISPTVSTK